LRRKLIRATSIALAAVVGLTATGCVYLEVRERELVYRPVRDYARTPADLGLAFDDVWLPVAAAGGAGTERVHGWWMPAAAPGAPSVLYLHGIRWSLGNNLFRIARWHALGFNVLAIDYRGFGRSDGELPSEDAIYIDARAAWAELARREPDASRRFIYGHSLGAAVAINLAANEDGAAGVIAESGFTSLADVVAEKYAPVGLLLSQKFEALQRVGDIRVPILFVHGTADAIVPFTMSHRLYEAAREPKRLLIIEGGTHSNFAGVGLDEYRRAVDELVALTQSAAPAQGRRDPPASPMRTSLAPR
jgi:fermentation-respiration switch protein FrsA (DUF1100 family)